MKMIFQNLPLPPRKTFAAPVFILGVLYMMSCAANQNVPFKDPGGPVPSALAPCPKSPNCVSSLATDSQHKTDPLPFRGTAEESMERLKRVIENMPRTHLVRFKDGYLHAEFRSLIFRFVDDFEALADPEKKVINVRSASRVGYSDLGVNRRRIKKIREVYLKLNRE